MASALSQAMHTGFYDVSISTKTMVKSDIDILLSKDSNAQSLKKRQHKLVTGF